MINYSVNNTDTIQLSGEIDIPPSKSHTHRAILFGSLADGITTISNYLPSPDIEAMVEACRLFGAKIDVSAENKQMTLVGLKGQICKTEDVIDAGNSGIILRFCAALGGLAHHPVVITGDPSIRHQRPMKELLSGLSQLGASAISMRGDDYAPVIIQGPLLRSKVEIYGEDSQPVSALIIACAFANHPIEIHVKQPGEKPWLQVTLDWLDRLNIPYKNCSYEKIYLTGKARYSGFEYTVPGDFSSAAFPMAAALITQSELTLKNIDISDSQGDKELINVLMKMGAQIEIDPIQHTLRMKRSPSLSGITVDINNFIDALPILAVVACYAEGQTHLYNAAIAKQKECNRIASIAAELQKMGAHILETEDGLIIKKSILHGAHVHSYHDHRIAMSLTVAGLGASGQTIISDVECISKTFPSFLKDFNHLGANIRLLQKTKKEI